MSAMRTGLDDGPPLTSYAINLWRRPALIADWQAGATLRELAVKYDVSRYTADRWTRMLTRRAGASRRPKRQQEPHMPRQAELLPTLPRKPRRVIAHMIDAGNYPDGRKAVQFACRRCAWVQWMSVQTDTEARRGRPCPNCN